MSKHIKTFNPALNKLIEDLLPRWPHTVLFHLPLTGLSFEESLIMYSNFLETFKDLFASLS